MRLTAATIVRYSVYAGMIGILTLVVVATSVFIWTRRQERRQYVAMAAWSHRTDVNTSRGAATPEEAYTVLLDAVKREDEKAIRVFSEGMVSFHGLQELPEMDRVTFLPDIVSGVAHAVVIDDVPATTLTVDGRAYSIPAGRVERVLLFHQLTNGRWVLVLS